MAQLSMQLTPPKCPFWANTPPVWLPKPTANKKRVCWCVGKCMRVFELRGAAITGAMMVSAFGASSVGAAVPLAFPAEQSLIPLVVGGAFVFPAILALAYALLCRIGRRLGPIGSACLLAVAALAIVSLVQPGLIPLRGS